jgi:hypothetical protein
LEAFSNYTTRIGRFAECLKHSANPGKQSAKRVRQTVHWQRLLCRVLFLRHSAKTLLSARRYSVKKSGRHGARVTETTSLPSVLGDTRQRSYLCRVSTDQHPAKNSPVGPFVSFFAECSAWHSAKRASLPSARATTLGKEAIPVPRYWFFAECYCHTRFWKANRMRTMYVPGSELTYTAIT